LSKATLNYLLALVMALLGLIQLVSGFVLWLALPPGSRGGTFLFSRDVWLTMHNRSALLLAAIVILHIILHWSWIVRMTKSYFKRD
jgi:cytochrome b subunit of formate dehydrogenase